MQVVSNAENSEPRSQLAEELIEYLKHAAGPTYACLTAVDFSGYVDALDLIVEPQLPQDRAIPIRNEEPLRLTFSPDDDFAPNVYSLRGDFPLDLVHTNYEVSGNGRCLCIWEESWADLRRGLTAQALVERIRNWFTQAARGELHQESQPLEPMIPASAHTLVLPAGKPPDNCYIQRFNDYHGRFTVVLGGNPANNAPSAPFALFQLTLKPQVHGALHAPPNTLDDLENLLMEMGEGVVGALGDWLVEPAQLHSVDQMVVILITIPKKRATEGEVESWDVWAFTSTSKLFDLGERLGRTTLTPDGKLGLLMRSDVSPDLAGIRLEGWRVTQRLDRRAARLYAGNPANEDAKLVGIGAGAIGSNVMANATRAGVGSWTVIDDDVVLPHNTVRQAQTDEMVGFSKVETTGYILNHILAQGDASHIDTNFLRPGKHGEAIQRALADGDLTIDFSASPAVLGHLADSDTLIRAASFFFNPDGTDLVVLAEDNDRVLRLDEIEAQYFLAAADHPSLEGHFSAARIGMVRYANACQDLTRPLPPWQVQALSGVAAGYLLSLLAGNEASAKIWRLNSATGEIIPVELVLANVCRLEFGGFKVSVSEDALQTVRDLRSGAAPNETGGVLLGSFDRARSVLHILKALPAPPDSKQSPTYFIRGAKELKPQVDTINRRSMGTINYVGEWHSHPEGAKARPSDDDEEIFAHLKAHLDATGAPYVMAICGDEETWLRAGWLGRGTGEGTVPHERS